MYLKGIALFVAIFGHGALAALPDSCEEGDGGISCSGCTPLNSEFEPPGVGQVWYSYCCTDSETTTADPPVTTTKKYCYSYSLVGWPNNQYSGTKPSCSSTLAALAWSLHGQCSTTAGDNPYDAPTGTGGCPGQWDSSTNYEIDDTVEDNQVVYKCTKAAAFCNTYGPDLRGVGAAYWTPIGSCTGTAAPTGSPNFSSPQDGCPEEFDPNTTYEANDSVAITRDDGTSILYRCKAFPESQWCNDDAYSPLNTEKLCNGGECWPRAWIKVGACTGTFTPTATPTFNGDVGGCPEAYDDSADYEAGDKVSITPPGETHGKIYQCKSWPNSGHCGKEAYSPANTEKGCNGEVCWPDAWTYVGGCTGTLSPTATPTFNGDVGGCPEAYDDSAEYEAGDKVSITPPGGTHGKIYQCKSWPNSGHCVKEAYSPANTEKGCNGEVCWPDAWTYIGGCTGTITPTATPTFNGDVGGCPEAYDDSAEYEEGDKVSVTPAGEAYGKIYQCKSWPNSGFCGKEAYSPLNTEKVCNGELCWPTAWTYVGGCTGTITPTGAPVFTSLAKWEKEGCPDEYVANNPNYKPGDYVSVSKNEDNTYGVVWMCKNAMTAPWCQNEGYAPGTSYGGQAWEKVGYCEGTMSPTLAPTVFSDACQFKYNLETTDDGAYVVLQAESWQKGGSSISTGGTALELYKPGQLVRYGSDARKCNAWPYSGYCEGYSPFIEDSPDYNPLLSSQGWEKTTCVDIGITGVGDTFDPSVHGPVFASNGNLLVDSGGNCQKGEAVAAGSDAINPEDYFKPSPAVKGCQKCEPGKGLDSITDPKVCTACNTDHASGEIVNRKSVCVCKNGATNPWAGDITVRCTSCPSGEKYLGKADNTAATGVCKPACPSGFVYTSKVASSVTYKLCCKNSGCASGGKDNILSECYDGTADKSFCRDAEIYSFHPTRAPTPAPTPVPTPVPTPAPA